MPEKWVKWLAFAMLHQWQRILFFCSYTIESFCLKRWDVCLASPTGQSIVKHAPKDFTSCCNNEKMWLDLSLTLMVQNLVETYLGSLSKASWIGSGFWLSGKQRIALGFVRGKYFFSLQCRNEWMTVTIPASKRFDQIPRWVSRIQPLASCI